MANYPSSKLTLEAASKALASEDPKYADLLHLARPLFRKREGKAEPTLWQHQWDSLKAVIKDRKDIVVTTGTSSGKTECFLLPLLAELARESSLWEPSQDRLASQYWWRNEPEEDDEEFGWRAQWGHTGRAARGQHALRAIVLYPLNALVEDQLRRLRESIDGEGAHQWLDLNRNKNRILFARYTGLTPVPGHRTKTKVQNLRDELKEMEDQWEEVLKTGDESLRLLLRQPLWGRDVEPLGHAGHPARHSRHQLQHAEYHADATHRKRRRGALRPDEAMAGSRLPPTFLPSRG